MVLVRDTSAAHVIVGLHPRRLWGRNQCPTTHRSLLHTYRRPWHKMELDALVDADDVFEDLDRVRCLIEREVFHMYISRHVVQAIVYE
jgi:hypothetical protein